MAENSIMGIQLKSTKSRSTEDVGESSRLDVELDFCEIYVCMKCFKFLYHIMDSHICSHSVLSSLKNDLLC